MWGVGPTPVNQACSHQTPGNQTFSKLDLSRTGPHLDRSRLLQNRYSPRTGSSSELDVSGSQQAPYKTRAPLNWTTPEPGCFRT
ncbi:hypothetical protein NDU88_000496 [Pleurodeles waltl]|uniref:Uncharacterized protein n=1 Tax=Pleurodeles waltl TaxID=8319 RepID=A0AAV7Q7I5_PLEWA|nr:hypothetical protein NDU88_000496 [Pleurodeles waltl]